MATDTSTYIGSYYRLSQEDRKKCKKRNPYKSRDAYEEWQQAVIVGKEMEYLKQHRW